jgi:hypothetical protein
VAVFVTKNTELLIVKGRLLSQFVDCNLLCLLPAYTPMPWESGASRRVLSANLKG